MTATAVGALALAASPPADAAAFANITTNAKNSFAAATTFHPYQAAVLADAPFLYWRLQETSGTTAADSSASGKNPGTYTNGPVFGADGAIGSEPDDVALDTGSNGYVTETSSTTSSGSFSVEAWVRTSSHSGGELLGLANSPAGTASTSSTRQLYVAPSGKVVFGVNTSNTLSSVTSGSAVNDGSWHHVVGTYSSSSKAIVLYVDGVSQGTKTAAGTLSSSTGYWRAGAEAFGSLSQDWPTAPTSNYLDGDLDEIAVYPSALSAARVTAHDNAAG